MRGSYSRAFRAPNLAQTDPAACAFVTEDVYTPRADPDPIARIDARRRLSERLDGRRFETQVLGVFAAVAMLLAGERPPRLINPEAWPAYEKRRAQVLR